MGGTLILYKKVGELMLQTPINVTPSNGEVIHLDKTQVSEGVYTNPPEFGYTFQGDRLSYAICEMYDRSIWDNNANYYKRLDDSVDQGSSSTSYVITDVFNGTYHRNAPVVFHYNSYTSDAVEGHDYMYRYRIYQCYPQSMTAVRNNALADIYYGRGKIHDVPAGGGSVTQTHIYIEPNLTSIEAPWIENNRVRGGIWIEVNNTRALINSYDATDGRLSLASSIPFPTGGYPALVGKTYKLYTNYIVTPWYDFKYRAAPEILCTIDSKRKCGARISGSYNQSNAIGIKWYQYEIYKTTLSAYSTSESYVIGNVVYYNHALWKCTGTTSGSWDSTKWREVKLGDNPAYGELIETGEKCFRSPDADAYPWTVPVNEFRLNEFCDNYIVRMTSATQEDDFAESLTYVSKRTSSSGSGITELYLNGTRIYMQTDNTTYEYKTTLKFVTNLVDATLFEVWRWYYDKTNVKVYEFVGEPKEIANHTYEITDYTAKNHMEYHYEVVRRSGVADNTYGTPICSAPLCAVTTEFDGWAIMSLNPVSKTEYAVTFDKHFNHWCYNIGETWTFISDINSGDITRNINSQLHVGVSDFAKTSRDNTRYESGSFTANLLTIECPDGEIRDDIERVDKWMKFICGDNPFLLKSAKGDVWVVSIVNSPNRRYEETLNPIFTNVTYEWAQSRDIKYCEIGDDTSW